MPASERTSRSVKAILEPEFAARLLEACDQAGVPPQNYGRLRWLKDQFAARFSESISTEAVRRWLAGEGRPKPDRIRRLADILNVDEAWLALGHARLPVVRDTGAAFEENHADVDELDRGAEILSRIRRRLEGTVKVAPGVDLTAPTGEIWNAERD